MSPDEQAIREVMNTWMTATAAGDLDTVLGLMTDDVVFLVPGQAPFGKEAFAAASRAMRGVTLEGTSEVEEIQIVGEIAYARSRLTITVTPPGGSSMKRSGYTLSVYRKDGGRWRLARDANLLGPARE